MSKPFIILEMDRPRRLRYGMNALVTIEELTGKPITKLDLNAVSIKDLRAIIYAGLVHEDKELTPEKVGELIDEHGDMENVAKKLGEAMTAAFGKGKGSGPEAVNRE